MGVPKNGWFIKDNPNLKWRTHLGVPPNLWKPPFDGRSYGIVLPKSWDMRPMQLELHPEVGGILDP